MHGCSAGSSRWPASWPPCWAVPPTSSPGKAPSASSADPRARRLHGPARPESPAKSAGSLGRRAQFKLSGGRDSAGTSFHCPGCPGLPGPTARQSRPAAGGPPHTAPVARSSSSVKILQRRQGAPSARGLCCPPAGRLCRLATCKVGWGEFGCGGWRWGEVPLAGCKAVLGLAGDVKGIGAALFKPQGGLGGSRSV